MHISSRIIGLIILHLTLLTLIHTQLNFRMNETALTNRNGSIRNQWRSSFGMPSEAQKRLELKDRSSLGTSCHLETFEITSSRGKLSRNTGHWETSLQSTSMEMFCKIQTAPFWMASVVAMLF